MHEIEVSFQVEIGIHEDKKVIVGNIATSNIEVLKSKIDNILHDSYTLKIFGSPKTFNSI